MPAYLVGALVFMVGIIIFVMQNNTPVTIHFISWHTAEISLALVALIAALGGAIITFLVDSFRAFKTGRKLNELTNHNKKLERELSSLKAKTNSSTENKKPTT
jgi:uncharacterized integral membrane protein